MKVVPKNSFKKNATSSTKSLGILEEAINSELKVKKVKARREEDASILEHMNQIHLQQKDTLLACSGWSSGIPMV